MLLLLGFFKITYFFKTIILNHYYIIINIININIIICVSHQYFSRENRMESYE